MLFSYRLTSMLIGIVIAIVIFRLVRKSLLHTMHSVLWLLLSFLIVVFGTFPTLNDWIAKKLGVNYPPVLILTAGMGFILIKILTMDIDRSRQEQRIRILTEKLAILEGEDKNENTGRENMDA